MGFGQLWLATPLHQGVMLAPVQELRGSDHDTPTAKL